jgi:SPP1 gp7 family putative phage head morphogenesis protein
MNLPGKRAFAFTRSEEKINTFMDWIEEQVNKGLLEVRTLRQVGTSIESIWTNKYIWDSYSRGVQRARREMLGAGYRIPPVDVTGGISTVMGTPIHLERVGLLYSRVFRDLQGITDAMDTQISRVLAQAMIDGKGARQIAKLLTKTISGPVGDLGIKDTLGRFIPAERRARMLARTEMTRAYHLGNVQEMRNFGVAGVTVRAEWVTAGYNVCPECAKLEGRVFSLDEVEGMLPRHPNCRCCVIPQKAQE